MKYVLNIVYCIALVLYSPLLIYRVIFQNRYRIGWAHRFGKITRRCPDKKCIWIHCVSVGETNAARTIVEMLEERLPDHEIVIATTTDTGYARANALYGQGHSVFFYPFDFSFAVEKAFENIRPSLCMLMELEVWPNFIRTAKKRDIPVMVINGRLSDKSFPRYKKVKPLIESIFKNIAMVLAQTDEYAQRFIELGCNADRVKVVSSLKYDTAQVADRIEGADEIAVKFGISSNPLIVAGGTGPGEEKIIMDCYQKLVNEDIAPILKLALVPRKPERFEEVASLIKQQGFEFARFSEFKNSEGNTSDAPVILVDTMGDLRKFYSLATVAFVGRSLVPMGGSDMIESAALGKATVFGPYTFNFKQSVDALLKARGAIEVNDPDQLYLAIKRCLTDDDYRQTIAASGREVIIKNKGATQKTVNAAIEILNRFQ